MVANCTSDLIARFSNLFSKMHLATNLATYGQTLATFHRRKSLVRVALFSCSLNVRPFGRSLEPCMAQGSTTSLPPTLQKWSQNIPDMGAAIFHFSFTLFSESSSCFFSLTSSTVSGLMYDWVDVWLSSGCPGFLYSSSRPCPSSPTVYHSTPATAGTGCEVSLLRDAWDRDFSALPWIFSSF